MIIITDPKDIETKSFKIVEKYADKVKLPKFEKEVLKRVLHATSNLGYTKDLVFHPKAIECGLEALKSGRDIVVDAGMVQAGINKKILSSFGGKVICHINNKNIAREALKLKLTRSILCMRKSVRSMEGGIVAIGNAPTALFEVCELIKKGAVKPALIIGIPVGFVGAKESKKELRELKIPYITNKSRYGGSSVAAACVNALLKIAESLYQEDK